MGVQSGINRLIGAASFGAAAVSRMAASLKDKMAKESTDASDKAKNSYSQEANKTLENKRLIQDRINEIKNKKLDLEEKALKIKARDLRTKDKESKLNAQKAKDKVAAYEEKQAATKPAENVKAVSKFEFAPNMQEPAKTETQAITPENSVTNIDANDEEVDKLIEVKQKSLARSAAGREVAAKQDQLLSYYKQNVAKNPWATKSDMRRYLEEFGFGEDSSYYKSVGLDKHTLQRWQLESESGWGEDVALKFDSNIEGPLRERFKGNEAANDYLDTRLESVKFSIGYYNDANDLESNPDNSNFVEDINTIVKELKSGEYKELAKKYTGKDYDNVENKNEVEAASTPKYFVWDTEAASSEDDEDNEGIVF